MKFYYTTNENEWSAKWYVEVLDKDTKYNLAAKAAMMVVESQFLEDGDVVFVTPTLPYEFEVREEKFVKLVSGGVK